jgi:hypothetical protein
LQVLVKNLAQAKILLPFSFLDSVLSSNGRVVTSNVACA